MGNRRTGMERERYRDGAPWEDPVGYSRALRVDDRVIVSGTAPVDDDDGGLVAPGDPYEQARRCMEIVTEALADLGASPTDVVRTRLYVTDAKDWPEVGRAHREAFGQAQPATTLVEVAGFVEEGMLVEVEAEAVVDG